MSLSIQKIKNNRDEILKAEIGTLLFNLGKTHIGFWRKKKDENYLRSHFEIEDENAFYQQFIDNFGYKAFSSYKKYYKNENGVVPFEIDIKSAKLQSFFMSNENKVNFLNNQSAPFFEFLKGDSSNEDIVSKIFFRGCENINSGIDKGSPTTQLPQKLWISNAFGTIKKEIDIDDFDKSRICFFQQLDRFLEDKDFYQNPDWVEIRKWIIEKIKLWYSRLLSDSRYPVNDVSLWQQAYMSSSMFKAVCSSFWVEDENYYKEYIENPNKIKWQILGIQYDKLGLAEKALKVSQISWYRTAAKKTDEDVKKLLEEEIPIGNEIYRDETGIYFIVSEKADKNKPELLILIQEKFEKNFEGEIFPYIDFTQPSRGLMGLGYLIEKAKGNFLKSDFQKLEIKHDENAEGKCSVCKDRLASKNKEGKLICDCCEKRSFKRLAEWINHQSDETVWIDELQGKNGRIALVSLKVELQNWINSNFINSFIVQDVFWSDYLEQMKSTLFVIKELFEKSAFSIESYTKDNEFNESFFIEIENLIKNVSSSFGNKKIGNLNIHVNEETNNIVVLDKNGNEQRLNSLLNNNKFKFFIKLYDFKIFNELCKEAYDGSKKNNESIDVFINQIFFDQVKDTNFQIIIERTTINSKINWVEKTLQWNNLVADDVDFLSHLLLQLLLRKNPSPARLKRVWDTTEDFFKEIKTSLSTDEFLGLSERYIWNNIDIDDGEYADGNILFWAKEKTVYLITSTESFKDKDIFYLKSIAGQNNQKVIPLKKEDRFEKEFKPFFSILDPTPVSWQFAVSAEKVPKLIKAIEKKYYENFKWVYGKLPLHIGVVFQDHKKPLYLGIKALRKIRRDGMSRLDLGKEISKDDFKEEQEYAFKHQVPPEKRDLCEKYYSLFEKNEGQGKYEFYLFPEENRKTQLGTVKCAADDDKFFYYPNTFDFEFLDTNARRNEIFYDNGKRFLNIKKNRPYSLRDFKKFEKFRSYFSDKKQSMKLQKMAGLIYSKLEDWQGEDVSLKNFLKSAFINILELKNDDQKKQIAGLLGSKSWDKLFESDDKNTDENLYMFLDMFEFWHTALKEI